MNHWIDEKYKMNRYSAQFSKLKDQEAKHNSLIRISHIIQYNFSVKNISWCREKIVYLLSTILQYSHLSDLSSKFSWNWSCGQIEG
jgi:hypothetical protein